MEKITRQIRNNIFDGLRLERIFYAGELGDVDFLGRLYDLRELPSYDQRFKTADQDIWQHCENNNDWPIDWVFADARFNLLGCSDDAFLRFLCETVHPVVRPDAFEAAKIVGHYNDQLGRASWKLVESQKIAGRAVFIAQRTNEFHSQIQRASTVAEKLSSNWMQAEIRRIQDSIETDPALAIGTAKDLVESCCKTILAQLPNADAPQKSDDLPTLSKKLCKALALVPEGVPKEAKGAGSIKRTLSNLASITKGISELRGLYGSGHGRDGKHIGLEPRHARLAASCAIAFVDFATETYLQRHKDS
ncbi:MULTISPECIES: abortive infection family protein [unclassified Ruegeria]|uniref:abortive infection family protein n=1 Tax=unclassified Ruegeria TaxID=2625375 RepID=UPI001488DC04|nr:MULTISPECIES: abortive infection family protein [unclassified Ruegeria]